MEIIIYNFLYFLSGFIIANGIPHLINGLSGKYWPKNSRLTSKVEKAYNQKKFSSSPVANFIWGMVNIIIAALLVLGVGNFKFGLSINLLCLFTGFLISGIYIAWNFTEKKEFNKE